MSESTNNEEKNDDSSARVLDQMTRDVANVQVENDEYVFDTEKYESLQQNTDIMEFIAENNIKIPADGTNIVKYSRPYYETLVPFKSSIILYWSTAAVKGARSSYSFTVNDGNKKTGHFNGNTEALLEFIDNDMNFPPTDNSLPTCEMYLYPENKNILVTVNNGPGAGNSVKREDRVIRKGLRENRTSHTVDGASVAGMGHILAAEDLGYVTVMISVSDFPNKEQGTLKQIIKIYWLKHYLKHEEEITTLSIELSVNDYHHACDNLRMNYTNLNKNLNGTTILKDDDTLILFLKHALKTTLWERPDGTKIEKINTGFVRIIHGLKDSFKQYFESDKFKDYLNENLLINPNKMKIKINGDIIQPKYNFSNEKQCGYTMKDGDENLGTVFIGFNKTELIDLNVNGARWQGVTCEKSDMTTRGPFILVGKDMDSSRKLQEVNLNGTDTEKTLINKVSSGLTSHGKALNKNEKYLFYKMFSKKAAFNMFIKTFDCYNIKGETGNMNPSRFMNKVKDRLLRLGRCLYVGIIIEPSCSTSTTNPDLYAATPPSECLRLMLSKMACGRRAGTALMYADVSRAYFYAKAERPVYVKLPDEDVEEGDEGKCGRLRMSMYGTRDAALNWAKEYGDTLREAGFTQGLSNPCLFENRKLGVSIMVHGDDFVAVGPEQHLRTTRKALEDKYKIKVDVLGLGAGQSEEVRILNKVIRMTKHGIELEADPRHVELAIRELGLEGAKVSSVPGAKPVKKKDENGTDAKTENVDNVQEAKGSAGNVELEMPEDDDARDDNDDDPELGPEEARMYRGVAARYNYIAPDRPDIAFSVKEAARAMSAPRRSHLGLVKKIGK